MKKTHDYKKRSLILTFIFALFMCFLFVDKVSAATTNIAYRYSDYSGTLSFSNSLSFSNFSSSAVHNDIEDYISNNEQLFIDRYYSGDDWLNEYNYICLAAINSSYICYVQLTNSINDVIYGGQLVNPNYFFVSWNYMSDYNNSIRFNMIGFYYNFYIAYDSFGTITSDDTICPATSICGRYLQYSTGSIDSSITISQTLLDSKNNSFMNYNYINSSYFTGNYPITDYYRGMNSSVGYAFNSRFQVANTLYNYDYSTLTYLYYHNDYTDSGGDSGGGGDSIDYTSILDSIDSSVSSILTAINGGGNPESPNSFGSSGSYSNNDCIGLHCITEEYTPTFTGVISGTMSAIQYLFYLLDYIVNLNAIIFNMILVCLGLGIARLVLGR